MTSSAVLAESSEMGIIAIMAGVTVLGRRHPAGSSFRMAGATDEPGVCASQNEIGLDVVIEDP